MGSRRPATRRASSFICAAPAARLPSWRDLQRESIHDLKTPQLRWSTMRVLFVTQDDFSMPSEMHVLGFAEALAERGHTSMISMGGRASAGASEGLAPHPGVEIQEHKVTLVGPDRAAINGARRFAPDVIHSWLPRVPAMVVARAYSRRTGAPFVVHFEDDEWYPWPMPPARLRNRARRELQRRTWRLHPPWWVRSNNATLRWASTDATAVDAISPALANEVETQLGRACAVILPALPQQTVVSGASAIDRRNDEERIVLFTGRVMPSSFPDFTRAIDAVADVRRRGIQARLVQTGAVDPHLHVLAFARAHGLDEEGISLLGHLPYATIAPTLRDADVLVQPGPPSRFNRLRLPSKLQSYLESGTPTITFAVGIGELLRDREEVLLTHTGEAVELADRLEEVLRDARLRETLSAGGLAAAERLFNAERNTTALLRYYDDAISRHAEDRSPHVDNSHAAG